MKKKTVALLLALVLVFGVAAGGTLAWLTAQTSEVKNTFTYGDINIELTETTGNAYKIIPGVDIEKDPKVTVKAGSEACWLFVKIEETGTFVKDKVTYDIATGVDSWTALEGVDGVYYREVSAVTADTDFYVLKDNKVTVSNTLTKEDIKTITEKPTLTVTAYASQLYKNNTEKFTPAEAWTNINSTSNP